MAAQERHPRFLFLSQSDVKKTELTMKKTIELVEETYKMLAMGEVENPTKTSVFLDLCARVPISIGSLDVSTANWVYETAEKIGLGVNLELFFKKNEVRPGFLYFDKALFSLHLTPIQAPAP